MINIGIIGCGHIAQRISKGIMFSKGNLYACASRDIERAKEYQKQYGYEKAYSYAQLLNDDEVDLIYIATHNPSHHNLIRECLEHSKNVICEKPMVATPREVEELFALANEKHCFLMSADKTCFTPLNTYLKENIAKIGKIISIDCERADKVDFDKLHEWNKNDDPMSGSMYDIGVYPLVCSLFYADSEIEDYEIDKIKQGPIDVESNIVIRYKNGIISNVKTSWLYDGDNKLIIKGSDGIIEATDYWKNNKGYLNGELLAMKQESDFTGEIDHAIACLEKHLCQSDILSKDKIKTMIEICAKVRN